MTNYERPCMIPLNLSETKVVEIAGTAFTIGRMPGFKVLAYQIGMEQMRVTGCSTPLEGFIRDGLRGYAGKIEDLPPAVAFKLFMEIQDFNRTTEEAVRD